MIVTECEECNGLMYCKKRVRRAWVAVGTTRKTCSNACRQARYRRRLAAKASKQIKEIIERR